MSRHPGYSPRSRHLQYSPVNLYSGASPGARPSLIVSNQRGLICSPRSAAARAARCLRSSRCFSALARSWMPNSRHRWSGRSLLSVGAILPSSSRVISLREIANDVRQ